jgi:hypothetical protein
VASVPPDCPPPPVFTTLATGAAARSACTRGIARGTGGKISRSVSKFSSARKAYRPPHAKTERSAFGVMRTRRQNILDLFGVPRKKHYPRFASQKTPCCAFVARRKNALRRSAWHTAKNALRRFAWHIAKKRLTAFFWLALAGWQRFCRMDGGVDGTRTRDLRRDRPAF